MDSKEEKVKKNVMYHLGIEERKITLSTVTIDVTPKEIYTKKTLLSYSIIHIKESFLPKVVVHKVPNGLLWYFCDDNILQYFSIQFYFVFIF